MCLWSHFHCEKLIFRLRMLYPNTGASCIIDSSAVFLYAIFTSLLSLFLSFSLSLFLSLFSGNFEQVSQREGKECTKPFVSLFLPLHKIRAESESSKEHFCLREEGRGGKRKRGEMQRMVRQRKREREREREG